MSEIVAPTAAAIIEVPHLQAVPNQLLTRLINAKSQRPFPPNEHPIARQARPEPAEWDAQEDRQGGAEGHAAAGTAVL